MARGRIWLRTDVGTISLSLSPDSSCEIWALASRLGQIRATLPLQIIQEHAGLLHGKLGEGEAEIRLSTDVGSILIGASRLDRIDAESFAHHP